MIILHDQIILHTNIPYYLMMLQVFFELYRWQFLELHINKIQFSPKVILGEI